MTIKMVNSYSKEGLPHRHRIAKIKKQRVLIVLRNLLRKTDQKSHKLIKNQNNLKKTTIKMKRHKKNNNKFKRKAKRYKLNKRKLKGNKVISKSKKSQQISKPLICLILYQKRKR